MCPIKNQDQLLETFADTRFPDTVSDSHVLELSGIKRTLRQRLRERCPDAPGVYAFADGDGNVIYVGMSTCLQRRLPAYYSSSRKRRKESRIGRAARLLIWQPVAHELIAQLRERELIRNFKPVHNVYGHPTRMDLAYLVLIGDGAPAFQLRAHLPSRHAGFWGPLSVTKSVKTAVAELNLHFRLRDCPLTTPMRFSDESPAPDERALSCIRAELKTCLAPCIGGCSSKTYARALTLAKSFLSGRSCRLLDQLTEQMQAACAEQRYERAAQLRDRLDTFRRLNSELRRFHDWMSRASFVYPIDDCTTDGKLWLIVVRGVILDVISCPQTRKDKRALGRILQRAMEPRRCRSNTADAPAQDFDAARVLFRWFRKHPAEACRQRSLKDVRRRLKHRDAA